MTRGVKVSITTEANSDNVTLSSEFAPNIVILRLNIYHDEHNLSKIRSGIYLNLTSQREHET